MSRTSQSESESTGQPSNRSPLSHLTHFLNQKALNAHTARSREVFYKNLNVAGKIASESPSDTLFHFEGDFPMSRTKMRP